jgi:hypothetical protein
VQRLRADALKFGSGKSPRRPTSRQSQSQQQSLPPTVPLSDFTQQLNSIRQDLDGVHRKVQQILDHCRVQHPDAYRQAVMTVALPESFQDA